jgi:peptide/nickel transport system ATP-binding protein
MRCEWRDVAAEVLDAMRLRPEILDRYPRQLSGGQRQRVALARAVIAEPDVILCDEVTSALDVSVQATIIELLAELRATRNTAIVFVTHDLGVLKALTDNVLVMQRGVVRERGATGSVLAAPEDAYTQRLLASLPDPFDPAAFENAAPAAAAVGHG